MRFQQSGFRLRWLILRLAERVPRQSSGCQGVGFPGLGFRALGVLGFRA